MTIDEVIEQPRIYNLETGGLHHERGVDADVVAGPEGLGHVLTTGSRSTTYGTAQGTSCSTPTRALCAVVRTPGDWGRCWVLG